MKEKTVTIKVVRDVWKHIRGKTGKMSTIDVFDHHFVFFQNLFNRDDVYILDIYEKKRKKPHAKRTKVRAS